MGPAPTGLSTLSLRGLFRSRHHLAYRRVTRRSGHRADLPCIVALGADADDLPAVAHQQGADRKSTRLNSSHVKISDAVLTSKTKNHPATPPWNTARRSGPVR